MVSREYTHEGHTTRVTVTRRDGGWQLVEERDLKMVRDVTYHDWHRVERAMHVLEMAGNPQVREFDS
jgi:hypothetical protein